MSSLSLYRTGNYPDYPLYTIDTTPYAETSPVTGSVMLSQVHSR